MKAVCITVRDPFRPLEHRTVAPIGRRRRIRALAPKTKQPFSQPFASTTRRAWSLPTPIPVSFGLR